MGGSTFIGSQLEARSMAVALETSTPRWTPYWTFATLLRREFSVGLRSVIVVDGCSRGSSTNGSAALNAGRKPFVRIRWKRRNGAIGLARTIGFTRTETLSEKEARHGDLQARCNLLVQVHLQR